MTSSVTISFHQDTQRARRGLRGQLDISVTSDTAAEAFTQFKSALTKISKENADMILKQKAKDDADMLAMIERETQKERDAGGTVTLNPTPNTVVVISESDVA